MRRREFITLLGGAAAAWPLAARAQQAEQMRRIVVILNQPADDLDAQARLTAFLDGLQQLNWTDGRNVRIDIRWAAGDPDRIRKWAAELAVLAPDVILATGSFAVGPLLQVTRAIPIVFVGVPDPVGAGFVDSLARPGGNATGFLQFEYTLSGKWLELLKEIAPGLRRVAVLRDPAITAGIGQFAAIQSAAAALGVEITPVNVRDAPEIERAVAEFARSPDGGLILTGSALAFVHRKLIIELAARHKLPAVYQVRLFVADGGLVSYGADLPNQYRRAAGYVDRILKGEKPADLPVQAPTKFELMINLKTAKALGLDSPDLRARPRRRGDRMKRREFITLLGGAAAWPLAARAQQPERMRRIGVLMTVAADDPEGQARIAAFLQGLQELGWTDGRNVRIDYRWVAGDADRIRKLRGGIDRARAGRHPGLPAPTVVALRQVTPHRSDRVRGRRRSGRRRLRRQPGAAGRQRHWLYRV